MFVAVCDVISKCHICAVSAEIKNQIFDYLLIVNNISIFREFYSSLILASLDTVINIKVIRYLCFKIIIFHLYQVQLHKGIPVLGDLLFIEKLT